MSALGKDVLDVTRAPTPAATSNGSGPPHMTAWEQVQLARHRDRPRTLDYVDALMRDFIELHGDRTFGDDRALIGGMARFGDRTVMVLGHQKGRDTKENLARNFGMARPEGYRKADRLLRQAEKFGMPVITLIDTPGAEPNIGSEERGQATAIAESIMTMSDLRVPIVAVVISEGGSGGALAIGVADRVLMLEHAIYSVISPEGAAAILWKDATKAPDAAATMRITAADLLGFGIIDEIVPESVPAHEAPKAAIRSTGDAITQALDELDGILGEPNGIDELLQARYDKFRRIGAWRDERGTLGLEGL